MFTAGNSIEFQEDCTERGGERSFAVFDAKKLFLDSKHPLPAHTVKSLRDHLLVEWTYHLNAIEGNTLT